MNTKRQTIWLVSMLSLMVVLSAYYLFTEDTSDLNVATDPANTQEVKVDNTQTSPVAGKSDGKATDSKATDSKATDSKAADSKAADSKAASATTAKQKTTDDQVLDKVKSQATSGSDYFAAQQMKRDEDLAKKTENLLTIITDSKQNTEALNKAYDEMQTIETQQAKLSTIEEELTKDFHNVMVQESNHKWKVIVQTDKMEKSQAVSIVDLVMKELNVGPEKIEVQVVPQS